VIIIKNKEQIAGIRRSSKLAALVLKETAALVKPGIDTESLNTFVYNFTIKHHAIPAPLNYNGFPKSVCTSINNVVCHGIPSKNDILKEGDIINIDVTTILDGYFGDVSLTSPVGKISQQAQKLINVTQESLNKSIKSLAPGKYLNNCVGKIDYSSFSISHSAVIKNLEKKVPNGTICFFKFVQ
jgi:methionyl aminopeptidase